MRREFGEAAKLAPENARYAYVYAVALNDGGRAAEALKVLDAAQKLAADLASGPTFANAMTKRMLEMEWAMSVETAVEAEASPPDHHDEGDLDRESRRDRVRWKRGAG